MSETKEENKRKEVRIEVVATEEFKLGSKTMRPPPNAELGRAKNYVHELGVSVVKALGKRGILKPAFAKDAQLMKKHGLPERFCVPHYKTQAEEKAEKEAAKKAEKQHKAMVADREKRARKMELEAAAARAADEDKGMSSKAKAKKEAAEKAESPKAKVEELVKGNMAELIEGLELVGLNPDDYANNGERKKALDGWLEAN